MLAFIFVSLSSFGDVHAVTLGEKWFSIISMLVGIGLFFGLILGGIASMLTNLDSGRARYIHHVNVIKDHMVRINSLTFSRNACFTASMQPHTLLCLLLSRELTILGRERLRERDFLIEQQWVHANQRHFCGKNAACTVFAQREVRGAYHLQKPSSWKFQA